MELEMAIASQNFARPFVNMLNDQLHPLATQLHERSQRGKLQELLLRMDFRSSDDRLCRTTLDDKNNILVVLLSLTKTKTNKIEDRPCRR